MSNNSTGDGVVVDGTISWTSDGSDWQLFPIVVNVGYTLVGLCMLIGGTGVWAPIVYHRALRLKKTYLLIAALTFADSVNGTYLCNSSLVVSIS